MNAHSPSGRAQIFRKMKKQNYLCVDLKTRMQKSDIQVGEARKGMLVMTQDQERFEFDELVPERWTRNGKVFEGRMLNVAMDKQGRYRINFHRMTLDQSLAPAGVAALVLKDLLNAKKELGL